VGFIGVAGLGCHQPLHFLFAIDKGIGCIHRAFLGLDIGRGNHIMLGRKVGRPTWRLPGRPGDQGHIAGCRHMFRIRQAIGIGEMCIQGSCFCRPFGHQDSKILDRTADVLRNPIGSIIGRGNRQAIQRIIQRDLFSDIQGNVRGAALYRKNGFMTHRDDIGQVALFQSQQGCHDLRDAGGIHDPVHVLAIQDLAGLGIHQASGKRL